MIEPVCFVAQGGDSECNAASDEKPMEITKAIDGVLLTCGYVVACSELLIGAMSQCVAIVQTNANYTSRHDAGNVTRHGAADVAQTPCVEVSCFRDVVDIIVKYEGGV